MAIIIVKSERCAPLTQLMYGWSSYGGSNQGLVDDKIDEEWACQVCGAFSEATLPPFYFEFSPREFVKICESCHAIGVANSIFELVDLINLVRKHTEDI